MEHPLADVQWGVRHVLQYEADEEVIEPDEVREELARGCAGCWQYSRSGWDELEPQDRAKCGDLTATAASG